MKKQFIDQILAWIGVVAVSVTCVHAQSGNWDPYVHSVSIAEAPLLPLEFYGTGVGSLKPGNNGGDELPLGNPDGSNSNDLMVVTFTLANGVPNVTDPSDPVQAMAVLGGPGVVYWDWTYNPATLTYRGVQNRPIPAYTAEEVTVQYKVTVDTFLNASPIANNGLNVNIQPPGYTNPQPTDNDKGSSYTYVEAIDFGDAPASYGAAQHMIDLTKDTSGFYNNYMYLGSAVDPEAAYQASSDAQGDDGSQTGGLNVDDEDGVTFPAMTPGSTVTIPVAVTIVDGDETGNAGRLSAWFDWNGDGDFKDAGERVASNVVVDYDVLGGATGIVNLTVTVPANATTGQTFARFRFGPSLIGTSEPLPPYKPAVYGEVEDYQITIQAPVPPPSVTVGDRVWEDLNGNGVQDGGEPGLTNVTVRLLDATNGVVATAVTDVNGNYLFANRPAATYKVEVVPPAQYVFTTRDAAAATDLTDSDVDLATGRTDPAVMAAGTTNLNLDAGLYVPAVVRGYVFRDANGDLLRNAGDVHLTNVLVRLIVGGVEYASVTNDAFGYYEFGGVPAGAVSVLVSRVGGTLAGVPAQEPDASDEARNRALPDGPGADAFIVYGVVSGQGVLPERTAETLNFGFVTKPLSTALDVSVYATGNGGVMIELWTSDESGCEDIVILAWIGNTWVEVGRVPSDEIVGEGSNKYKVHTKDLAADGAYLFKIIDESGHEHLSPLPVTVKTLRVEAVRLDLQTLTLSFNTEAGRPYVVKVSTDLAHWTTEFVSYPTAQGWSAYRNTPFTAGGASTQVRVPFKGRKQAYFKIEMVE